MYSKNVSTELSTYYQTNNTQLFPEPTNTHTLRVCIFDPRRAHFYALTPGAHEIEKRMVATDTASIASIVHRVEKTGSRARLLRACVRAYACSSLARCVRALTRVCYIC